MIREHGNDDNGRPNGQRVHCGWCKREREVIRPQRVVAGMQWFDSVEGTVQWPGRKCN